jgi:hypothetical protein
MEKTEAPAVARAVERPWIKKTFSHIGHPAECFAGFAGLPEDKKSAIKAAADALKLSGVDPFSPDGIVRNMIDSLMREIFRERSMEAEAKRSEIEAQLAPLKAEQESLRLRLSELRSQIEPLEKALSELSTPVSAPAVRKNVLQGPKPTVDGVPAYALQGAKSWDEKIRSAFAGRTLLDRKELVIGLRRYSEMKEKGLEIEISRAIARGTLVKNGEGLSLA